MDTIYLQYPVIQESVLALLLNTAVLWFSVKFGSFAIQSRKYLGNQRIVFVIHVCRVSYGFWLNEHLSIDCH